MASYNAPQENISEFNETLFMNNNTSPTSTGGGTGDLTKAQADTYYLSKTTTDTSTAPLTTFESVNVNSTLKSNNITGLATTGAKNIFTNLIAGSSLVIGSTLGTNTINGNTTLNGNTSAGSSNAISANFFYFQSGAGTKNLFTTATTASINFASSTSTTSFSGVSTFNQEVKIPTRLTRKGTLYANEVKTISGTSATLTFPLEDTTMLTSNATTINITLPLITTSTQAGLTFAFFKTASTTNSVIFTASGTNQIWINSSITNGSPLTDMGATKTETAFMILEVSTGIFVWKQI